MLTKVTTYEKDENGKYQAQFEILVDHKIITLIMPSKQKGFYNCYDAALEPIFTTDLEGMRMLYSKNTEHKGWSGIDIEQFTD